MELKEIENAIEAVLFASGEPVSVQKLSSIMDVGTREVQNLIKNIQDRYKDAGIRLIELGDCYQFTTREKYADFIKKATLIKKGSPLSQAALEVLAIVAYNGPVSKGFIEQIRGVDSSSVVNTLIDKGLIEESGRLDLPGKPISYSVTAVFLRSFSLSSLNDLPKIDKLYSSDQIII